jgi:hypothetical protein
MKTHSLLLIALAFALTGCDTFFKLRGTVRDYRTGAPIAGATARLVLDRGVEEPDQLSVTDDTGIISFGMNEPRRAWATLTVQRTNYSTWSTQFRGSPRSEIEVRLIPLEKAGKEAQ